MMKMVLLVLAAIVINSFMVSCEKKANNDETAQLRKELEDVKKQQEEEKLQRQKEELQKQQQALETEKRKLANERSKIDTSEVSSSKKSTGRESGTVAIIDSPDGYLNLRARPTVNSEVLESGYNGEKIVVLNYGPKWSKVRFKDRIGYMGSKFFLFE